MVHYVLTTDGTLTLWCPTTLTCLIDSGQVHFPDGAISIDMVRRVEIYDDDLKHRRVAAEAHAWPVEEKEFFITHRMARELGLKAREARKPPVFPIEQ